MQYVFGAFCLDLVRQGVYQGDTLVPLEPKPYAVLVYLARHWTLDELPERLAAVEAWVEQVLGAFGGTILALERTALMLGFGVPIAQEDHAMRALAAAATLRQRAPDMPLGGTEPLVAARHLRVAVSTGLSVVASDEVDATQPSRVFGEVGPDAQRLASQAAPGTLVVNAAMAQLIHPMLRMEPPFSLANDAPASDVYCVTAEDIPYLSRPLRGARESSPFVGRDDDLAFLHTQLRQVHQGHGQVLGIMAEADMGKSRLLREFRQSLEGQAITYLSGRCQPYGMTALFEPFLDLVRQCCQIPLRADASRLRSALDARLRGLGLDPSALGAYLGHVLGLSEEAPLLRDLSPQVLQGRVFEAMHQVFLHGTKQQPLVLEVEDIHWIAQSPEAYLSGFVSRVGDAPLLLLLTYRPEYQPNWLQRARRELQLLLLLGPAIGVVQGLATPQREQYYARAHALSQQVGDVSQLAAAVFGLGQIHYARGELYHTQALGERLLAQVGAQANPSILIKVHGLLTVMAHNLGELTKARQHAELGIAMYTEQASGNVLWHPGDFHPGMVCYMYRARPDDIGLCRAGVGERPQGTRAGPVVSRPLDAGECVIQCGLAACPSSTLARSRGPDRERVNVGPRTRVSLLVAHLHPRFRPGAGDAGPL